MLVSVAWSCYVVEQAKARRRVRGESRLLAGESGVEEGDIAVEGGDVARWEEVAAQAKAMEVTLSVQKRFTPDPSHASFFTFGATVSEVHLWMTVEGAFVQGEGFFTMEEVLVDEAIGKLLSFDTVSLLHGTTNKQGVLSSKSSGEPPLLLAVSNHSAIHHAIAAARHQFAH
ncbi:unnamed protein product [Closterium sp. NIES-65]|nr:unnamed protein product [Closterium sp. NIES-65]